MDVINSHDGAPTFPDESDCIDIPAFELKREELKRSNEELDEEEMIYFTAHLAARAKRLEVVRRELDALNAEKAELEIIVRDDKAIVRPSRRVPRDILEKIFLLLVNEDLKEDMEVSSLSANSFVPWRLAQVSKGWRAVALKYPRLWSTIRISSHDNTLSAWQSKSYLLGLQLRRSGDHPLQISISSRDRPADDCPLIHILLPTSLRWRKLSALLEVGVGFDIFTTILGSTQLLQAIYISTASESDSPSVTFQQFFSGLMPSLRFLSGSIDLLVGCATIPWAKLQHYHEHTGVYLNISVPARPAFPSLMQMVELETCSLICNFHIAAGMQGTFRHLRHLKLTGETVAIILEALVLPALVSLHVNSSLPFLQDLIRILPNYPTVRGLYICHLVAHATNNWQSYMAVLEGSPALTVFVLQTRSNEQREFMSGLIQTPNIGVDLATLKVKVQKQRNRSSEAAAQMQRAEACNSLRNVRPNLNVEYNSTDESIHLPDLL
ncbi:hypothetical protein C8J56DRAFT_964276 [Mycena floridula]|nr:hypothetical protein C8J56DRAFT_964276 [Mycena floridula]